MNIHLHGINFKPKRWTGCLKYEATHRPQFVCSTFVKLSRRVAAAVRLCDKKGQWKAVRQANGETSRDEDIGIGRTYGLPRQLRERGCERATARQGRADRFS